MGGKGRKIRKFRRKRNGTVIKYTFFALNKSKYKKV